VTAAQASQCLSDPKGIQRLLDMTQKAEDNGVGHTPTFLINGKMTDAATWEALEPQLKAALAGRG
jgi:protein-disulfide isomerase